MHSISLLRVLVGNQMRIFSRALVSFMRLQGPFAGSQVCI